MHETILYILQVNEHNVVLYLFSKQSTIERDWSNPRGIKQWKSNKDVLFYLDKKTHFSIYSSIFMLIYTVSKGGSTKRRVGNGMLFISFWK